MNENEHITKQNHFNVPENYFQKSALSIFNKIEWQEEHQEFPNLLKHKNSTVFGLPENYFEENEARLNTLLEPKTKVISLFSHKMWYAAAATLVIALGFWAYDSYFSPAQKIEDCKTLACVDQNDLLKSNIDMLDYDDLYNMVDLSKLEQSLDSTLEEDSDINNEDFE